MESLTELRRSVASFGYNDYLRHLKAAEELAASAPPLRVAVLRTYTVEPIEPVLRLRLILEGYQPSIWFGRYNQYVQDILEPGSGLADFRPDLVLMMVRLEELLPDFIERYPSQTTDEWRQALTAKAHELAELAGRAAKDLSARVLIQNGSLAGPYFGIFDAQQPDGQQSLVHQFNAALAGAVSASHGVFLWDFDAFARRKGYQQLLDPKAWYVSRNPFKQAAYPAIVEDLLKYVQSTAGKVKKCVVVDLDNTLWGGIVGEDGFDGIRLGETYPGNCYRDFQRALLTLSDRGILLAINSKNNEEEALRVFDEHPDMVLRRRHFAAMRINWQDKASNLRALARELNIGLDSLLFIDDNPAECALIRQEIPECDVVVAPDKPYLLPAVIDALPGVENIRITPEDRRKGEMYQARRTQQAEAAQFSNVEDFLRSLDMEVAIEPATSFTIPRIAQLTQKTNQMNMTTRRYTESEIATFAADPRFEVLSVAAKDRFGDHGIVGVLMLEFENGVARIDTFLLSCRVIGRGIERAMLAFAAAVAQSRNIPTLVGQFFETMRNAPASGFYEAAGFTTVGPTEYRVLLQEHTFATPDFIRLVRSDAHAVKAP